MKRLLLIVLVFAISTISAAPSYDLPLLPGARPVSTSHKFLPFREISYGSRIINGSPAVKGQFPWQAALYLTYSAGTSFCGGSLISPTWILTAAHCTDGVAAVTAYLGVINLADSAGRVVAYGSRVVIHPSWSWVTAVGDIALVQLTTSVALSNYVSTLPVGSEFIAGNIPVTVSGWGKVSDTSNTVSTTLNHVALTTITNEACFGTFGDLIQSGIICAGGVTTESTCNGDSGGPLITGYGENAVLIGIVSFVSDEGCAKGYPSAYTRVSEYRGWITSNSGV